jgi:hypothetical protein
LPDRNRVGFAGVIEIMSSQTLAGFAVVIALALGAAAAVGAFAATADLLPGEVAQVLRYARDRPTSLPRGGVDSDGFEVVIVDGPPTGAGRAVQVLLMGTVAGVLPAALVGGALATRARRQRSSWPADWSHLLLGGWAFQLAGLVLSLLLLPLFVVAVALRYTEAGSADHKSIVMAAMLLLNSLGAVCGLRSWRELLRGVAVARPPSVVDVPR